MHVQLNSLCFQNWVLQHKLIAGDGLLHVQAPEALTVWQGANGTSQNLSRPC